MAFDMIIKNGIIVTASEVYPRDLEIGIKNGKINCIGIDLQSAEHTKIIDAEGAYITPGGVDSHVHLAQANAPTGDGFETGTPYHNISRGQSYCDYGFHLILANPTEQILQNELLLLSRDEGITSVKILMTYDALKLDDLLGITTMIHAESHDIITLIIEGLERHRNTEPFSFYSVARPRIAEDEASYRAISLAELSDAPILIVHMSSDVAVSHVRDAQTRLLPIHAETCPHYLFLLSDKLCGEAQDHFCGAKHVSSPPLRHDPRDLENLWKGIVNGTFTTWSSDHAPSKYNVPHGKRRMALLFDQTPACKPRENARLSLPRFVQLTSTNAAKLYGLGYCKGTIAPGYDADLVIWYPSRTGSCKISNSMLHHDVDYTPFEGMEVGNWPRYTILRGQLVWDKAKDITGKLGYGQFLKRNKG
ncbi:MAG: hypothetical protein FE78DRAFT_107206 [Acidomyces sp. 'richmondensis']|nr:MAG: hypothetical protein FE78DRAFT_107206 [Acidomyces sp. 'richmondensis']